MIQHCRKTLHSRTKGNRLVIQFQKALWRKLQPLFNRNKKLYASKEVEENALSSEGKSCRPETKTTLTVNWYVCYNLSVWNKRPSIKCRTRFQSIYLAGEKTYWNKLHFGMRRGRLGLPPPFIAVHPHRSFRLAYPLIDVWSMADAKTVVKVERIAIQNILSLDQTVYCLQIELSK